MTGAGLAEVLAASPRVVAVWLRDAAERGAVTRYGEEWGATAEGSFRNVVSDGLQRMVERQRDEIEELRAALGAVEDELQRARWKSMPDANKAESPTGLIEMKSLKNWRVMGLTDARLPAIEVGDEPGVYLLWEVESEWFKIGETSVSSTNRLSTCQTGNPHELRAVAFIPAENSREVERELHDRYSHLRGLGEWFRLSMTEVREFRLMCDGRDKVSLK